MGSHGEVLRALTKDEALVRALLDDYRKAPLGHRERAMLDYAFKLTREPGAMNEDDVARLREAGLDDPDIADVNGIAAYFNMLNRIASGLGVEGEPGLAMR